MTSCIKCPNDAFFNFGEGHYLCPDCAAALLKRCEIKSVSGASSSPGKTPADATTLPRAAAGVDNSVSAGAVTGSLPSGESEPVVTLASAPAENLSLNIPPFLRRGHPDCFANSSKASLIRALTDTSENLSQVSASSSVSA